MWLLESCPNSGIRGKQWPITGWSFLPHGECLCRPAMASTQECMSDSSASPRHFLHLFNPACTINDVKQIPKEGQYSVNNIWFAGRQNESHHVLLINDRASHPNDDEWPHYHQMILTLVCFCLLVAQVLCRSRFALGRLRWHPQAKTNDRSRLCWLCWLELNSSVM